MVAPEAPVPLFDTLGTHHHPISTDSDEAQKYFDQGLIFAYGFNHAEAVRSFEEAARLDPNCAICYWGVALALGPNINAPMFDEAVPQAYRALQKAQELASNASESEQGLYRGADDTLRCRTCGGPLITRPRLCGRHA
jgi:tetratricopeptide (TPR) repeat protein